MSRAERRRRERDARKVRTEPLPPGPPVRVHGENMIAHSLTGNYDSGRPVADLPEKVPGRHRWVASACWTLDDDAIRREMAGGADGMSYLDHETMFMLALWCWDCEAPFPEANPDTPCRSQGPA